MLNLEQWIFIGAALSGLAVVLLPAMIGDRASLGQRTVYLAPATRHGVRWRLIARALVIQGSGVALFSGRFPWLLLVPVLACTAAMSICVTPRGISGVITGCSFGDARVIAPAHPSDHERI